MEASLWDAAEWVSYIWPAINLLQFRKSLHIPYFIY